MVIKDVTLSTTKTKAILSAKCKIRKIGWDTVYFKIDASKKDYICNDASPFAVALLIPSMRQGEDLIIKGGISKQLYEGMQAAVREIHATWGGNLKKINIHADTVVADTYKPREAASFFTGGVDSFYTYLKHKNDPNKADRVDSFVLVKGFDIHPKEQQLWKLSFKNVQAIADAEKIDLTVVESNLHELFEELLSWADLIHGSSLAAVGLFLRKHYRTFYIPSSFTDAQQGLIAAQGLSCGSSPAVDKLWGTEFTRFIHDGDEATRLEKVLLQVSKSPIALKYLRVCYVNKAGRYNCGSCDKCLRTMVNLRIAGVLDKAETFPDVIDIQKIAGSRTVPFCLFFQRENLAALQERKLDPELQHAIESNIANSLSPDTSLTKKLKKQVVHKPAHTLSHVDYSYNHSRGLHRVRPYLYGDRFYQ